jgi:hypothetical protein
MVRTAAYGARLGLPWIADLDDLLSLRYSRLSKTKQNWIRPDSLLGYYQSAVASLVLRNAAPVMGIVLSREAAVLSAREHAIAEKASVTSVVSQFEAATLANSTGRPIVCTPMAVTGSRGYSQLGDRSNRLVFLGGLDYLPNWQSVLELGTRVMPELADLGMEIELDVIGTVPERLTQRAPKRVRLCGYVEELDLALQEYKAMLIPAGLPGGIKTKMIHAAVNGTLILAHSDGLEGMELCPGVEALTWSSMTDLLIHLKRITTNDTDLDDIAAAAQRWAERNFSADVIREKWASNIRLALQSNRTPSVSGT